MYTRQISVNKSDEIWKELARDTDAFAIASLMWSWLQHLQQPVLTKRGLSVLLRYVSEHTASAAAVESATSATSGGTDVDADGQKRCFSCGLFEDALKKLGRVSSGAAFRLFSVLVDLQTTATTTTTCLALMSVLRSRLF